MKLKLPDLIVNGLFNYFRSVGHSLRELFSSPRPKRKKGSIRMQKHEGNPILSPKSEHSWESQGAFNTAAVDIDDEVHLLYRAIGNDGISLFGYAKSKDGFSIDLRDMLPAYWPRAHFEGRYMDPKGYNPAFGSGGGCGGCEDPKLTRIGNTIYLTYVAFAGYWPPRTAISSISTDDFVNRRWNKWSQPQLISPPNTDSKSACLLSEKVNGKYVMFHRTWPHIYVDYLDDLDFSSDEKWLKHNHFIPVRKNYWDSHKISMAASPVKTEKGWLAIYGGVDKNDWGKYKMGAMLLDHDEPHKVICRSNEPIIEPEEHYEHDWKNQPIVYPSGVVVKDDNVLVYYGGGDLHTCVAHAPVDRVLDDLKKMHQPRFSLKRLFPGNLLSTSSV